MTASRFKRILQFTSLAIGTSLLSTQIALGAKVPAQKNLYCKPTGVNCYTEAFKAPAVKTRQTDLLFVVQTSDSIARELPTIRNNILQLVEATPQAADLNIAVMLSHGSTSSWSGRLFQVRSEPIVLQSKKLSKSLMKSFLDQKLTELVQDVDSGGGSEGLFSLFNGITTPSLLMEAQNAGFFRSTADLAVVFIADERDVCAVLPSGVPAETDAEKIAARFRDCEGLTVQGLRTRLKQLKGARSLLISGVLYAKAPVPADTDNELGYGYLDLIKLNGGEALDIIRDDIAGGLQSLVLGSAGSLAQFTLSHAGVDAKSVRVHANGKAVAFKLVGNKVSLLQAVPSGASVIVDYCINSSALSTKAEKLAAIMAMSCPIYNKSYPKNYVSPSPAQITNHLRACTSALYPETPTTAKQQKTLDRLLDPQDASMRVKMFKKLWYSPPYSDDFEFYFGLEIKEAVQVFCLNNPYLPKTLVTSEFAQANPDQLDHWRLNPVAQKREQFAQSIRRQLLSCVNK